MYKQRKAGIKSASTVQEGISIKKKAGAKSASTVQEGISIKKGKQE
jgi:hypothetical protein